MANPGPSGARASSDAVFQTLKWARKQGFKPVPLRKQSKASLDEKYVEQGYTPPPDSFWSERDIGIGVLTGPKSGGPVDTDIDCPEAQFFAERFLPPTPAIFGRKSKPRSHFLYRVETEEFAKRAFIDPISRSCIIELRGDGGHQTVFPGSLHEDTGEPIEWSDSPFPDVPRVDATLLDFSVKKIAIAVLIARHMWAEGQRNEICKHLAGLFFYLEWSEDETKSLITAVMEYSGDEDKTRLKTVSSTYKKGEKGGKVTGSNTLRTFLGDPRLVDRILDWAGSKAANLLQEYNERFAVVTIEGKFRIAETLVPKSHALQFFAKDDFLNLMMTDTFDGDDGKPVPKCRVWLSHPRRRTYRGVDFLPGVEDASPILNLWTGWALEPHPTASCQAWLDLLFYTICGADESLYQWMLHWFANLVREPLAKPMTAPVIIGRQGAGKSLLLGYFGKILGPGYVAVTNEEHIHGRFNKHLASALLLHSEEALFGGEIKHRGIIKSLITDEFRIFEQKGVDAKAVHNYTRLILTSNEVRAAPAEMGDRRFTVIDMEGRISPSDRIAAVLEELKHDGPAGLFHHLLNMKYDPAIPRTNVKNESLLHLKQINFDPLVGWWFECLRAGTMLPDYLSWASKPERVDWPQQVSANALYAALLVRMREQNNRYVPNQTVLSMTLCKMTGVKLQRQQKYYTNPMADDAPREVKLLPAKQYTITNLPPLADCRTAFELFIGQPIDWPQLVVDEDTPAHAKF